MWSFRKGLRNLKFCIFKSFNGTGEPLVIYNSVKYLWRVGRNKMYDLFSWESWRHFHIWWFKIQTVSKANDQQLWMEKGQIPSCRKHSLASSNWSSRWHFSLWRPNWQHSTLEHRIQKLIVWLVCHSNWRFDILHNRLKRSIARNLLLNQHSILENFTQSISWGIKLWDTVLSIRLCGRSYVVFNILSYWYSLYGKQLLILSKFVDSKRRRSFRERSATNWRFDLFDWYRVKIKYRL